MVDFQSRETRRGPEDDDGEEATPFEESEPAESPELPGLGFAVVTVGSGRTIDEDATGDAVVEMLSDEVGEVVVREVIEDRYDGIQSTVGSLVDRGDVDVVLTVGGTGPQPSDVTIDAVEPLLDKHLPGVGELIRRHCAQKRGSAVVRTRTMGGILEGVPIVCLPGEPEFARSATQAVVVPEAESLATLAAPSED
jgi:molybdenum cofactor biosynthesis protein B